MATCNPSELIEAAKCFQCLSSKELKAVIAQLLCNISQGDVGNCDNRITLTDSLLNDLFIQGSTHLLSVSLPNLTSFITGNLVIAGCSSLQSMSAPLLGTVALELNINSNPVLTTLDISSIQTVGAGALTVDYCDLLTSINVTSLVSAIGINIDNNLALTTINLPSLTICPGDINFSSNPLLTSISIAPTVGGWTFSGINFVASNCSLLTSFNSGPIVLPLNVNVLFDGCALDQTSVELILALGVASGTSGSTFDLSGGTNFGQSGLSPAGAANLAALLAAPNVVSMNP